jgi:hypothetical protein
MTVIWQFIALRKMKRVNQDQGMTAPRGERRIYRLSARERPSSAE